MSSPHHTSLANRDRHGALAVAIFALISAISCFSFFIYILYLVYQDKRISSFSASDRPRTIRFLRTQFGILFINLLVADLIQAIGFGMSFPWAQSALKESEHSAVCTTQAVFIQTGDVASTLFTFVIALHTFVTLVPRFRLPKYAVPVSFISVWVLVAFLAFIGPVAIETSEKGPFYGNAGLWCWIKLEYDLWRLWLHYIFIFIVVGAVFILYPAVFISMMRSGRSRRGFRTAVSASDDSDQRDGERTVQGIARKMLVFPFAYAIVVLPIAYVRVATISGMSFSSSTLAAVGSIYTLSGFVNCLVYSFTRNIVPIPRVRRVQQGNVKVFKVCMEAPGANERSLFNDFDNHCKNNVTSRFYFPDRIPSPPPGGPDNSGSNNSGSNEPMSPELPQTPTLKHEFRDSSPTLRDESYNNSLKSSPTSKYSFRSKGSDVHLPLHEDEEHHDGSTT